MPQRQQVPNNMHQQMMQQQQTQPKPTQPMHPNQPMDIKHNSPMNTPPGTPGGQRRMMYCPMGASGSPIPGSPGNTSPLSRSGGFPGGPQGPPIPRQNSTGGIVMSPPPGCTGQRRGSPMGGPPNVNGTASMVGNIPVDPNPNSATGMSPGPGRMRPMMGPGNPGWRGGPGPGPGPGQGQGQGFRGPPTGQPTGACGVNIRPNPGANTNQQGSSPQFSSFVGGEKRLTGS